MLRNPNSGSRSYSNPVLRRSFPDPFVLESCGRYYAYCTGIADDGLAVGMAYSDDLVEWQYHGGVLGQIDARPPLYWAPEVTYWNGRFYMYYSCGNEALMEIRVAVSEGPAGPFEDSGNRLTSEEFAIDPHVFVDDDGQRYLFYATDFLQHTHIGTGTVVDRMLSSFELEGHPVPVTRAAYDWQVYDPNRAEKGGVRWHTIEGPTVLKAKGTYIQMFSGGNWKNETYGVAYASSPQIVSRSEWKQSIDGATLMPILTTIPEKVIGPGHNSVAIGPNGRELFCVYHSWVDGERMMSIDRMGIVGSRLFVSGPTTTPQPAPFRPSLEKRDLVIDSAAEMRLNSRPTSADFLLNIHLQCLEDSAELRIALVSAAGEVKLSYSQHGVSISGDATPGIVSYPPDFSVTDFHRLELQASENLVRLSIEEVAAETKFSLPGWTNEIRIGSAGPVDIGRIAITYGFEELFLDGMREWEVIGNGGAEIRDGRMIVTSDSGPTIIASGDPYRNFEFVTNLKAETGSVALALIDPEGSTLEEFDIGKHLGQNTHELSQVRIVKIGDHLSLEREGVLLESTKTDIALASVGIISMDGEIEVDMVRWTEIPAI